MKDVLLSESGDLLIQNGDLVIGESSQQHVGLLVELHKGELKEFPTTGFGISRYLKKSTASLTRFTRELKIELEADGFPDAKISISEDLSNLEIEV